MANQPYMPANPRINAPGVSQRHRLVDAIQPETILIDPSTLADRLLFIAGLARQVNFFENNLNTANWTPFFEKSAPFVLARLIKTDLDEMAATLARYAEKVEKQPEAENLRILADYVGLDLFGMINSDYVAVSQHPSDFTVLWSNLIRTNLHQPLLDFVARSNGLVRFFDFPQRRFWDFYENDAWDIESTQDLFSVYPGPLSSTVGKTALLQETAAEFLLHGNKVLDVLREVVGEAPNWLNDSLEPLREDLRQLHEPHLGLLFAFLQLFELFSDDLNGLSKKHLEFFFKDVLNLVPQKAVPDQAHLIFEIQKNLERYKIEKGTAVKDGKDSKKADVLFQLDEEIVVDKAKVESLMTLFLNPVEGSCIDGTVLKKVPYTEGVYIAPVANSLDGIGEPFPETKSKNWRTLGSKPSKLTPKGKKAPQNHPAARMGFVLASPVLLLQEGIRTIEFNITCEGTPGDGTSPCLSHKNADIFDKIKDFINHTFYVITEEAVKAAQEEGLSPEAAEKALAWLQEQNPYMFWSGQEPFSAAIVCNNDTSASRDATVMSELNAIGNLVWKTAETLIESLTSQADQDILKAKTARKIFSLKLSGEKEWISVSLDQLTFELIPSTDFTSFTLKVTAKLPVDTPAVTFYNKAVLLEDFESDLPTAKFVLDPDVKVWCPTIPGNPACCFERGVKEARMYVSLYQVFSNTKVRGCKIDVTVCGVRKLVVQNDEALQDVNKPMLPFGPRPKLGANFYIGSNEVLGKNWQELRINVEWKDRPVNFGNHYNYYFTGIDTFEDGNTSINDSSFKVKTTLLNQHEWKNDGIEDLFAPLVNPLSTFCPKWAGDPQHLPPPPQLVLPPKPYNVNCYYFDKSTDFTTAVYTPLSLKNLPLLPLNTDSADNFLRMSLHGVSFQHERYGFELARQMMMLAGLVDPFRIKEMLDLIKPILEPSTGVCAALTSRFNQLVLPTTGLLFQLSQAIADIMVKLTDVPNQSGVKEILDQINIDIGNLFSDVAAAQSAAGALLPTQFPASGDILTITTFLAKVQAAVDSTPTAVHSIPNLIVKIKALLGDLNTTGTIIFDTHSIATLTTNIQNLVDFTPAAGSTFATIVATAGVKQLSKILCDALKSIQDSYLVNQTPPDKIGVPLEPYTPTIKELVIDYRAIALVDDLIFTHLYPYENTHKTAFIPNKPTLIPTSPLTALLPEDTAAKQGLNHPAEGTLFIGLKNLKPGTNLSLLFQLAESTANTESEKARVAWQYLANNEWKDLREGFEILNDATEGLTSTGIVKIAIPADITNGPENTVLPRGFHWLKVAALSNADAVCETIGIHAQAVHATFSIQPENDTDRLVKPLEAGKLAKLEKADAKVKLVQQPYDSFGGKALEANDQYYQRASERLRHKGRAISLFDYERLVLQAFPQIFKAKCIPHTLGLGAKRYQRDAEWSAGFVTVAVVPDLLQLLPGENLYPRVPLSLLDQIRDYLCKRNSPFAKVKVMNPRYEGVDVQVRVRFREGYDQVYYRDQLQTDLVGFLAPWSLGDAEKLRFGQPMYRSDLLKFVETLYYVDYVTHLEFWHEEDKDASTTLYTIIEPRTARSILAPGNILVCEPEEQQCLDYDQSDCVPDCAAGQPVQYFPEAYYAESPQSS